MKIFGSVLMLCLLTLPASAQLGGIRGVAQDVRAQAEDQSVRGYDALLQRHVDPDGWVDYVAIAKKPQRLDTFARSLSKINLKAMEDDERLATLINAYNAFTLQLIVENYDDGELKSIRDLNDGKPWDEKRWRLGGEVVSLNQIEHQMIRPKFDEPRIHWALVCAAYSCPPLRNQAYAAKSLDKQLAEQEAYVLNLQNDRFVAERDGQLYVTRLFEWYGHDFGDWKKYVMKRLAGHDSIGGFLDYDWRLNSQVNAPN